jgi:hypothetical protein
MVWTPPKTWATGDVETAGPWNTYVRDNFEALIPGTVASVSWTPDLSTAAPPEFAAGQPNPETSAGRYWRVGPMMFVWVRFDFGISSSAGAGTYFVPLPVWASDGLVPGSGSGQVVGAWHARDSSATSNSETGRVTLRNQSSVAFQRSEGGSSPVANNVPFSWSSNDTLSFYAVYPAA